MRNGGGIEQLGEEFRKSAGDTRSEGLEQQVQFMKWGTGCTQA